MAGSTASQLQQSQLRQPASTPASEPEHKPVHPLVSTYMSSDIITAPDEYFQSLEPAWKLAFGEDSGAWITWEWPNQLRSSLHPMLFGAFYIVVNAIFSFIHAKPQITATILVAAPGVLQAGFATATDYFTWKLAEKVYGRSTNASHVALWMSLLSPWQFFCSTRAFSNGLETTLTIAALNYWPWQLTSDLSKSTSSTQADGILVGKTNSLRVSLILAAFACILRPTNIFVWLSVAFITLTQVGLVDSSRISIRDVVILIRETVFCGSLVLLVSALSDRMYYGAWTFPAYQWLHFNLAQNLAIFYGQNDWHYYLSQGLPLLLTTYFPFGLYSLWSATSLPASGHPRTVANIRFQLAFLILMMISTLSLISHKEVRFIYPLLPSIHVLAAPHMLSYLTSTDLVRIISSESAFGPISIENSKRRLLYFVLLLNIGIAFYTTRIHQRGVLNVLNFLRHEYEEIHLTSDGLLHAGTDAHQAMLSSSSFGVVDANETFAAFLMPCHSTPWRSHLVYPSLHAWALTCEPPIHIPANTPERAAYRDEADRFYDDPLLFLRTEVNTKEKPWPRYIVGFEGIEQWLKTYYEAEVPGWKVREKWRGPNSHWHDDHRRQGDVVVWEFVDGENMR